LFADTPERPVRYPLHRGQIDRKIESLKYLFNLRHF